MLYFGDPQLVQKHLHQDLNTIIKNVKIREEQHLELLDYNKAIVNKKRSIQNTLFINDQITMHNQFLSRIIQVHEKIVKQENEIIQKYDQASVKFESVIKLMSRVVTRIIETNHTFIEKIKSYDEIFIQQFSKMKSALTKLINNKEQIDLSQSTKTIIDYTKNKATHQIEKLKQLIKTLEDGEIQKVPFIYKGSKHPEPVKQSPPKIQKQPEKKASPVKKQEKHEVVNKIKNEIKAQQNAKKQRKNLANRLATMYSTMDLNRKDFIEDIVSSNYREFNRIYGEILMRNKFNQVQILEFQNKKEEFEEKVKLFKEMMVEESNKIQEVLMIKMPVKVNRKNDTHSDSASKIQMEPLETEEKNPQTNEDSNPAKEFKRAFILRQKANSPKFHKQTEYTQLRITQDGFNHIKFDSSNQEIFLRSNRNRLPMIQNKQPTVSVSTDNQHRYHLSKPKEDKSQIRKNFLMKNIELGVQNVIKQNQNKNQSESKNIAQKLRQIQPSNPSINNVNLMEFTFYGSKKKSFVLGQTKNSFVF